MAKVKPGAAETVSYVWKPGKRIPVSAVVAANAIAEIGEHTRGHVTPAAVVDAARDDDHPLHSCFEWDDSVAAERHRQAQARELLYSLRVRVVRGEESPVDRVAFISVTVDRESRGRAYVPTSQVMADDDLRDQALADALAALDGFQSRYSHLEELAELWSAAERVRRRAKPTVKRKLTPTR